MNQYRCVHCGRILERDSTKAWVKSRCDATKRFVHLMRVTKPKARRKR